MSGPRLAPPAPPHGTIATNERGIRAAQAGLLINAVLTVVKLLAGVLGNSYALIADAFESMFDILGSVVVWGGLQIAGRSPTDDYPFGYGRAEALASGVVSLMLIGAAIGIGIEAVREIVTPHHAPAPFTLVVLVAVILVKAALARRVQAIGSHTGSPAVQADALHHRSDAITSAAAFVGISVALWMGPGYEAADDWGALVASGVILYNGIRLLGESARDLMDRTPGSEVIAEIDGAARAVTDVHDVEKLKVRKVGAGYWVEIHVQADPAMPLYDAHELSGAVKGAIRAAVPLVQGVLVHMEPYGMPGRLAVGERAWPARLP